MTREETLNRRKVHQRIADDMLIWEAREVVKARKQTRLDWGKVGFWACLLTFWGALAALVLHLWRS